MSADLSSFMWLRGRVKDCDLLNAMELHLLYPNLPVEISTGDLMEKWQCSRSNVSRRLSNLWNLNLVDYKQTKRGFYKVRRIGPLQ